jgi:hypothetical protein
MSNMTPDRTAAGRLAGIMIISLLVAACAGAPVAPEGAAEARAELARLQSDPTLAPLAPVAIKEAEDAVRAAEETDLAKEVGTHRVYIANRRIEIARSLAEARRAEDQRKELVAQRDQARLAGPHPRGRSRPHGCCRRATGNCRVAT